MLKLQTLIYLNHLKPLTKTGDGKSEESTIEAQLMYKDFEVFKLLYDDINETIIIIYANNKKGFSFIMLSEDLFLNLLLDDSLTIKYQCDFETYEYYSVQQWIDKQLSRDAIMY